MSSTLPSKPRLPFRRPARSVRSNGHIRPDGSRDVELPIIEHLREFRSRLMKAAAAVLITTIISITFVDQEVLLLKELAQGHTLIATTPTETFVAYLKVALITGVAVSMPFLVYQLFMFLAPGLTRVERRSILLSLPAVTFFFLSGVLFCYFVVLPNALEFLLGFGGGVVEVTPRITEFLSFVTRFMMALGLAFETPVIIFILAKLGVATPARMSKFRRWAYVLAFILAAIITPTPDPVNQIIVAVPIILLYELGLIFARIGVRKNVAA